MTDFIPVVPLELMPTLSKGELHLCQAHLFKEKMQGGLLQWMHDNANQLVLDNGTFELGIADVSATLKVARTLKPFEVVCPDAYQDKDKTLKLFHAHALPLSEVATRVMIVPQGKSVVEWVECLDTMMQSKTMSKMGPITIGVPKVLDSYPGGRSAALAWVETHVRGWGSPYPREVQVHLLGMWRWLSTPMQLISSFPYIRSFDTTWAYACAVAGDYATPTTNKHIIVDWKPMYTSTETMRLAELNIAICKKAVRMACGEGTSWGHG